jgi:uncharacterized protein
MIMNNPPDKSSFVVDRMLGGLVKWLRIAGFDAWYNSTYKREDLTRISKQTGRIIITRDTWFESHGNTGAVVLHDNYTIGQLKELFRQESIVPDPGRFFTRCTVCNSELMGVSKDEIKDSVPSFVLSTQNAFSKCPACKRIYWGGTHKEKMLQTLKVIFS